MYVCTYVCMDKSCIPAIILSHVARGTEKEYSTNLFIPDYIGCHARSDSRGKKQRTMWSKKDTMMRTEKEREKEKQGERRVRQKEIEEKDATAV